MELNNFNIDDFLMGKYSKQEELAIREKMDNDPDFAHSVRSKKLESLVIEEIETQTWRPDFASFEEKYNRNNKRRQLFSYLSAAAITGVVILSVYLFFNKADPQLPMAVNITKDFNTQTHNEAALSIIDIYQLYGNWEATINENKNIDINIVLELQTDQSFLVESTLFLNNNKKSGDKLSAGGTWNIENGLLVLNLDESSIQYAETANPFQIGLVDMWLKNNRLFKKPLEIILLSQENLILKLNKSQGIEWDRK